MGRRFFSEKGLILLIGVSISVVAIAITYFRMKSAKEELSDYLLAKSCPTQTNCRQKVEATVLTDRTVYLHFAGGKNLSLRDIYYVFSLSIPKFGDQLIEVSSNPPASGTPFDVDNVRIPTGEDSHFVAENFHSGQPIFVEVWHNQITLLYTDTLVDVPDVVIQPTPVPGSRPILSGNPAPKTYEIVLATTIHPIFRQASTERDFISAASICSLLMLVILSSLSGKDIENVFKKRSTKNVKKQPAID
jgi:hypothetical protein